MDYFMKVKLKDKTVLITGAAYGIGEALAIQLAEQGCKLILVDIDKEKIDGVVKKIQGKNNPIVFIEDLSLSEKREKIYKILKNMKIKIDILVNNVGIGFWKYFIDSSWDKLDKIIDTNIKCMTHMTKLFLPDMIKRNDGYIVNLSSTASFIGSPYGVCYSSTKAYIRIFSETLNIELNKTKVKVLCVFPGATTTHFWQAALMEDSKYDKKVFKMTSDQVATETIKAIINNKTSVITGFKNKFNMFIVNFLPRRILKKIALKRFEG
jgi:short-subunit dehydrogenase